MPPELFHSKYTNIPYQKHFCLNKLFHSPATPACCAVNQDDSSKKEVSGIGECLGEPSGHNIHLRPEKAFHNPPSSSRIMTVRTKAGTSLANRLKDWVRAAAHTQSSSECPALVLMTILHLFQYIQNSPLHWPKIHIKSHQNQSIPYNYRTQTIPLNED